MTNRIISTGIVCLLVIGGFFGFITLESDVISATTTWYVGTGPGNDSTYIGYAIDVLASPGDTVFVHSGVYFESIWINKTINLVGEERNTTIIDGMGGMVVQVESTDWVNITGFTITNGSWGIRIVYSSFINIQGNGIYYNVEGIHTTFSSNCSYIDNIVHNQIKSGGLGGYGFFFSGTPYANNIIMGNIVCNNEADGIHFEDQTSMDEVIFWNNSVINNTVYNNTGHGISIYLGTNNSVIGNTVHHNGLGSINPRGGIRLVSASNNIIMGNTVHGNDNGFLLESTVIGWLLTENIIASNTVYKNDYAGIGLSEASDNTFIDNSIFDNSYNVFLERQSRGNNFINCSLSNATRDDFNLTEDSHAILLNTTFNKTSVYYGDTLSTLTVKWFMHVHVIYYNGTPASYAEIWINDTSGSGVPLLYGLADSLGWIRWFVVTEYIERDMVGDHMGNGLYFTPHNVTATDGSLWGYADPIMDKSKTVTIILGNYTMLYLHPGWNLVSLPRVQVYPDLDTVLGSIEGDYDAVQWFDIADNNNQWKHNHISKPQELNDLKDIFHTMGFWIHVTNPSGTTLIVYGDIFSFPQNIPLHKEWNQVGFPSLSNKTTTAGLNNLVYGVEVDVIFTFDAATQTWEEVGPGDDFQVGKGYWIHATQDCVWEVPL